jgi:hypothetical protein
MIRVPRATAEFTIRNLAPLTPKESLVSDRKTHKFGRGDRMILTELRGRGKQRSWMPRHQHSAQQPGTRAWCTCSKERNHTPNELRKSHRAKKAHQTKETQKRKGNGSECKLSGERKEGAVGWREKKRI